MTSSKALRGKVCGFSCLSARARGCVSALLVLATASGIGIAATPASAETPAPGWEVTATTYPTDIPPSGGIGKIGIDVFNIGAADSHGIVTVTDVLPPGIVATEAGDHQNGEGSIGEFGLWECSGDHTVTCTNNPALLPSLPITAQNNPLTGPNEGGALNDQGAGSIAYIAIAVKAETTEPGALVNHVTVAGGGASTVASVSTPIVVGATSAPAFGFQGSDGWFSNADGTIDTQAGSHPYEFTYSFGLNSTINSQGFLVPAGGEPRNATVDLPPGFIGNPTAVPECPRRQFDQGACPPSTQVGVDAVNAKLTEGLPPFGPYAGHLAFSVYNLVPPPGVPAQFGLNLLGVETFLDAGIRSGGDSGVTVHGDNLAQERVIGNTITLWGEPANPTHDPDRYSEHGANGTCNSLEPASNRGCSSGAPRIPFLTLPTSCEGPQPFSTDLNTWETGALAAASFATRDSGGTPTGFTGCDHLGFDPSISVTPDTSDAETPSGLSVDLRVPQEGLTTPGALATSDIKDTTVTLPEGLVLNPGRAAGLAACKPGDVEGGDDLPLPGEDGNEERFSGPARCPAASRVGTVQITTPLLEEKLEGEVFVLESSPPDVKLLVAASGAGVNVKLLGDVHLDERTGRLTTTFREAPQLPFTDLKLTFEGGAQAALVTPPVCGEYSTATDFTPWSAPAVADAFSSSHFAIDGGPGGSGCPRTPLPFTPSMVAGTTNPVGGSASSFVLKVSRPDDQQNISSIDVTLPPGQVAKLAGVPLCPAADTASGNCPAASQVGSVAAAVGPGAAPLQVPQPGKAPTAAYLAGPYKGAPYSLVVKVPAQAGPFDLGTITVRTALQIDPTTTQVTAQSDPLPQILDGVPLSYQSVTVSIDRPGFIRNPTSCEPMKVTGQVFSAQGTSAGVSSPYQVGDCGQLPFKPKFSVRLKGGTGRNDYPALGAALTFPEGPHANVKSVVVSLPHSEFVEQAHIRTICTRVQFAAGGGNGEQCPKGSVYGHAEVRTPLLDQPLSGPVFERSSNHTLPDLALALRGQIDLEEDGVISTDSRHGIRTSFSNVPDAAFSSFKLEMEGGKRGLIVNSEDLCSRPQRASVKIVAQNGREVITHPLIANDCKGKAKKKHSHSKKHHRASRRLGSSHR
jgi:hypothetical protein